MDLSQYFGNDLSVATNGDLLLATGVILTEQRIIRRLLTNPRDYIWDLSYGAGLPQYVGMPLTAALIAQIKGLITSQMYLEPTVAQTPPPNITLSANQSQLFCQIEYVESGNNTLQTLSFSVSS